jgi:restriction endonuclease S subunit
MKSKQQQLKGVASFISGYTFRGSVPLNQQGDTFIIQASDVLDNGSLRSDEELNKIDRASTKTSAYAKEGDVFLVSRSVVSGIFRSACMPRREGAHLVSSSVIILRPDADVILPEYLQIFLNSSRGQMKLQKISAGSHIVTLQKRDLEKIPIPIFSLEDQKMLVQLSGSIRGQKKLLNNKIELLDQLFSSITTAIEKQ